MYILGWLRTHDLLPQLSKYWDNRHVPSTQLKTFLSLRLRNGGGGVYARSFVHVLQ